MTKQEFGMFVMALKTYYPRETLLPNEQAIELWYHQLGDLSYDLAEVALNKWVSTNKWSPSIADIRETATGIQTGMTPNWGEGWEQVQKAIRNYGYYNQMQALESMDELTRQTVQQMGFRNICLSENEAADRANFRMIYERLAERKKQDAQIPERLRNLIDNMKTNLIEKGNTEDAIYSTDNN